MALEKDDANKLIFIDGEAGTGKTYTYKVAAGLVAFSMNKLCVLTATTGIAATLLKSATTVHKGLKIPFGYQAGQTISADLSTPEAKRLLHTPLIIIDQASALSKHLLEYIDQYLRIVTGRKNTPFGGKVIVLGGDFKQTLPVIEKGGQLETIANCVKNSHLWKLF